MKKWIIFIGLILILGLSLVWMQAQRLTFTASTGYEIDASIIEKIEKMRENREDQALHEIYKDLPIIDVHSHSVDILHKNEIRNMSHVRSVTDVWEEYGIDRTVLFGDVSEPSAVKTDRLSWRYYEQYPGQIYPSFAGVPLEKGKDGVERVKENLEKGYLAVGEIFAASTYSPNADLLWKGEHPYWGVLPEIYRLVEEYKAPILLHIDPPAGKTNMANLKKALKEHPEAPIIFAHGNVFNTPENLDRLLAAYDNLYIDFFAGFTSYNPASEHVLEEFVPLIEKYPDRFFLGSDSGVEIGIEQAYTSMYELIDLLEAETAARVAYQNYERLIESQKPTEFQKNRLQELADQLEIEEGTYRLNKREANELIFEWEAKLRQGG